MKNIMKFSIGVLFALPFLVSGCISKFYIHKYEDCVRTDIPIKFKDGSKIYSIHITQDNGNSYNFTRFPKDEYFICVGELCDEDSYYSKSFRINLENNEFYFTGKAIYEVADIPIFGKEHDFYYQVAIPDLNNTLHSFWISKREFNDYYGNSLIDAKYLKEIKTIISKSYKHQCVNENSRRIGTYSLWQMFSYGMKEPLEW